MTPIPPPNHPSTAVEAAAEPPSSASSSPTPLLQYYRRRKRLQPGGSGPADPIPTSTPSPTPTDSDSSGHKKTRDLPNLSECHACHFRVDVCNGKHRLQALYSEWRIVLLCKKCFLLVESSRMCSYCFAEAYTDCFSCRGCKRSVHVKCFDEYKSIAPWSYSCSRSEFSVCVDCWVPKSLASSSRVSKSRRIGEKLENSRVSDNEDEGNMLDDVVNNANCSLEKKIEVAERAREKASKKAVVARRVVELGSNALGLVAKRDGHGAEVVDDEQLAIQLHRAMNSSPRIAKNLSCLAVPRMLECNGDSSSRNLESGSPSVCGKLATCTNNKLLENPDKSVSEPSVCVGALDPDSSINMKCLKIDGMVDMTTSAKDHDGACPGKCDAEDEKDNVGVPLKEGEGSCSNKFMNSSGDDNSMDSESQPNRENSKSTAANVGNCNEIPDRYLIKYSKRRTNLETIPGACSMAIGEFVSVYTQLDIEVAQLKRNRRNGDLNGEEETEKEQLPNPLQAASASALAFAVGAVVPLLGAAFIQEHEVRLAVVAAVSSLALAGFGGLGAVLGGTPVAKSSARVLIGGWTAMAITFGLTKLIGIGGLEM